jgi:rubrerythrin
MVNIFSPQEILRIAVKVEENGVKLYESFEKKTTEPKIKGIWRHLKEQDELHRKIFQEMLEKVGDYIVYEFNPGEYDTYIRAIASQYIFVPDLIEKKTKDGFTSNLDAVDFGIFIEKESIFTYTALKEYITTAQLPVIEKIIDEEKKHLIELTLLKDSLKAEK